MTWTRKLGAAACVAGLALGAAACGGDSDDKGGDAPKAAANPFKDDTGIEVATKAVDTIKDLESVHIKGTAPTGDEIIEIDLSVDQDGNCAGSIGAQGGEAQIISQDGEQYLKGDEEYWKATAGANADRILKVLEGKWAKVPASAGSFAEFCNIDQFLSGFDSDEIKGSKITKGKVGKVGDVDALELTSEEADGTYSIWVATEGKPYLVKVEGKDDDGQGSLVFSEFDEPIDADVPPASQVKDLSDLR